MSRDSRSIYYFRNTQPGIFRVDVNGGEPEKGFNLPQLSYTGALSGWFGMDPEGMPVMLRDAGSDEIYLLTLSKR